MSLSTPTPNPLSRSVRRLLIPGVAAALALSACGSGSSASDDATTSDGATTGAAEGGIQVDGAWARTSPSSATAGAAYMVLTAASDDVLIGASVDSTVAAEVQIHETTMVDPAELEDDSHSDDSDMDDSDMDDSDMDVMQMREVGRIDLPAGEAVALEPGGYHIMMLDLPTPLEAGQTFELTLDFENADDMVLTIDVLDEAPVAS